MIRSLCLLALLAVLPGTSNTLAQCALAWQSIGVASGTHVLDIAMLPNGDAVIGGVFTVNTASGPVHNIARWNGSSWSGLGQGLNGTVYALQTMPNGDLIASGMFTASGGTSLQRFARWDGQAWSPLGSGFSLPARDFLVMPNGDLIAGGDLVMVNGATNTRVARWDGVSWSPIGGYYVPVKALALLPNGHLVAAGEPFSYPTGPTCVSRWDGVAWAPLGSNVGGSGAGVLALQVLPDGDLVAGGGFNTPGQPAAPWNITLWNGSTWSTMGSGTTYGTLNGSVYSMALLPDGDLAIGGFFSMIDNVPAGSVARWDGVTWSALAGTAGPDWMIRTLAAPGRELLVGGGFTAVGGIASSCFAAITTSCPAEVAPVGAACPGAGGTSSLTAVRRPWLGSVFESVTTGLPPLTFVVNVIGFAPAALPLQGLLPNVAGGCVLLASPDLLDIGVGSAGEARHSLPLPDSVTFAGLELYHQVVSLEVDAQLAFVETTVTNGLRLSLGRF